MAHFCVTSIGHMLACSPMKGYTSQFTLTSLFLRQKAVSRNSTGCNAPAICSQGHIHTFHGATTLSRKNRLVESEMCLHGTTSERLTNAGNENIGQMGSHFPPTKGETSQNLCWQCNRRSLSNKTLENTPCAVVFLTFSIFVDAVLGSVRKPTLVFPLVSLLPTA